MLRKLALYNKNFFYKMYHAPKPNNNIVFVTCIPQTEITLKLRDETDHKRINKFKRSSGAYL